MIPAHINPKTGKEQSVKEHCLNVSHFSRQFGSKIGLSETAFLAGLFHDLGKNNSIFEEYLRYSAMHPEDRSRRGSVNHSAAGGKYIYDIYYSGDTAQRLTAQLLALVICSHHSGFPDIINTEGQDDFIKKIYPDSDISFEECVNNFISFPIEVPFIHEQFYKSRDEINKIIYQMKQAGISNTFSLHLLVKYIFSCLIDADRLDTYNFISGMYVNSDQPLDNIPAGLWQELSGKLEEAIGNFKQSSKIAQLRNEISEECKEFAKHEPGVYQLCVPTGGGKTLSSLRYALEHAKNKDFNKQRIFYIIPYTTIIDQTAKVIREILKRDDVILEHHSNLIIDDDEIHELLTDRWDSPIVLTTMVQFLDVLFSKGTRNVRRMHQLANSIIIFDEIQTIPIKCIHLFNCTINFLTKLCNATIILCTATQPLLTETDKPIILSKPENMIRNIEKSFKQFCRVQVFDCSKTGGYSIGELSDLIIEKSNTVNSSLVIMNMKNTARELFIQLRYYNQTLPVNERFRLYHLSTNMCPAHRMKVLEDIRNKLSNERTICISTQLIEAGIDISFECVVRAVAGLDSIAQAAGRCNRHGEMERGSVFIVNMIEEKLSMLPDIEIGKKCTEQVLKEFKECPDFYGNDLLSPKAIENFYHYYFHETNRQKEMDYAIKKENTTIFDLLSINPKGIDSYESRIGGRPEYPLKQAFKTAGEHFSVIDQNTIGVIVPYGRGKELITDMNGNCNMEQLKSHIREAQRFSVNLFENDFRKIGNGIHAIKDTGALALEERFYDEELGVVSDGKPMEFLSE